MNALILAAGLGSRLRPFTNTMPKALVPVAGRPMLEHQILKLKAAGCGHIVVNIHHFGQQIIDFIEANDSFGLRIDISDERGRLLDTGGAVRQACRFFKDSDEPVLVHNVDVFSNASLSDLYSAHLSEEGRAATLLVSKRKTSRYLAFDNEARLVGWTNVNTGEVKTPFPRLRPELEALTTSAQLGDGGSETASSDGELTLRAFSGIHVFSPSLSPALDAFGEAYSIIDFYLATAVDRSVKAFTPAEFRLIDAGKPETLSLAAELTEI